MTDWSVQWARTGRVDPEAARVQVLLFVVWIAVIVIIVALAVVGYVTYRRNQGTASPSNCSSNRCSSRSLIRRTTVALR